MNRRNFINTLAAASAGLAFFSQTVAKAQTVPTQPSPVTDTPKPVRVSLQIQNNHGHDGFIAYEGVIIGQSLSIDIQGDSGHPHTLILSEDDLTVLRQKLVVDVKSTVDAGHAHMVRITRDPIIDQPNVGV